MEYLSRLEKTKEEVSEMMEDFLFEKNNEETKKKIVEKITEIFKKNRIVKTDTLEEGGWEVSFSEANDKYNNIAIHLKTNIELSFFFNEAKHGGKK